MKSKKVSRRKFLASASLAGTSLAGGTLLGGGLGTKRFLFDPLSRVAGERAPLQEFEYGDVTVASAAHNRQLAESVSLLMELSDDSLLKPLRTMSGQPAPGEELGGWYLYDPNFDGSSPGWAGFAPACTFGQWVSGLSRAYAVNGDEKVREKVLRLNRLYAKTITADFYVNNRFPAYCYDKILCGLIDSHQLAKDPDAYRILEETTNTAVPNLPGKAIEHGRNWRPGKDDQWSQDESYTMPENLFLAYQRGAGERYRAMGVQYLDDEYFDPLAEGCSDFEGRHAYSHVNALCSAMQAYLTVGSEKHYRAAKNGFDFLAAQSFATGGWGADEILRAPGSNEMYASLTGTHSSFETPCGSYAHFKLTRYLLRVTRDARYGDSMERVMYNTVLGAKPLKRDGSTFYYSDYNFKGRKDYTDRKWPCCSGTLPQVAADYGTNIYLRDARGTFVNLYVPSTVRWTQDGAHVSLTQRSVYPLASHIRMEVTASRPADFEVQVRIPAFAAGATVAVNGKRVTAAVEPGTFVALRREWKTGDHIDLDLPLTKRLETIDSRHAKTVALLTGPLVLFPTGETMPAVTRAQLLAAAKSGKETWEVKTEAGRMKMMPFTAIGDEPYSTYLNVS